MANIAHNKSSATLNLTSAENADYYVRTKYTSKLGTSITDPLKVRVLNMNSDATKYSAEDLISYINLVMKDKWVDGSEYSPSVHDIDMSKVFAKFELSEATRSHYPISLNYPANCDLSKFEEPYNGLWRYDSKIVRFAPNVIEFYSEPRQEWVEACATQMKIVKTSFSCFGKDNTIYSTVNAYHYPKDSIPADATWKVVPHETHFMLVQLKPGGIFNWYIVASNTTF